jgi:hypothetical protein
MLRIAGPDETSAPTGVDLCRILHPSAGLPGPVVQLLVEPLGGSDEASLADVVPIDDVRQFPSRPRPPARRHPRR